VADLMAKVPEKRAVGLTHAMPLPLPLGIVGFSDIDGNQAVIMPSQNRRTIGPVL
jgi:hypothetical protein